MTINEQSIQSLINELKPLVDDKGFVSSDEAEHKITLQKYMDTPEVIDLAQLEDSGYAHGGGDVFLIKTLYSVLEGTTTAATSFEASIESHLMGIYAEESRLQGGKLMQIHNK